MLGTFAAPRPATPACSTSRCSSCFPVLKEFLDRRGGNLSGGQQQQLAIARALLTEPKVVLLDEPTEGIQPNIVEQIEDVIMRLNREHGITVILVEQNVRSRAAPRDRFVIMEKGHVASSGTDRRADRRPRPSSHGRLIGKTPESTQTGGITHVSR